MKLALHSFGAAYSKMEISFKQIVQGFICSYATGLVLVEQ